MKETDFIHQNQEKWSKLEAQLKAKGKAKDYTSLGERFVQLSEDLSYAQTYYNRRTVRVYLNALAQRLYKKVFNARTIDKKKRGHFWSHELPTALWEGRLELSIILLVFLLAAFIGIVSSRHDDDFASEILGPGYVNMTEKNIENGDPMGVYKDMQAVPMFFMIMYNNLQVSAFTFILGVLFGVGTLGIIFKNGVMLGVFQYFFFQRGLGFESFLTILQHGTIEISSIVVAGGAGLVLGKSIVFPGTLPRSVSLKFGFLKGLKILLGVAPLIVLAAFIESFYTRFDGLPIAFRLATILASLAFIIGYYVVLPIKRGRNISLLKDVAEDYSQSHVEYNLQLNKLKNNGEILSDVLVIIQQNVSAFLRISTLPALVVAFVIVVFLREQFQQFFYFTPLSGFLPEQIGNTVKEVFLRFQMIGLLFRFHNQWLFLLMAAVATFIISRTNSLFLALLAEHVRNKTHAKNLFILFAINLLFLLPFAFGLWYAWLYILVVLPVLGTGWHIFTSEQIAWFAAFTKVLKIFFTFPLKHAGMLLITALFSLLVAVLIQSPVFYVMFELANDFVGFTENSAHYLVEFVIIFISILTLLSGAVFLFLNCVMNFRSMIEMKEATQLLQEIEQISTRKTMYGANGEH